jgi:hypothetical protein
MLLPHVLLWAVGRQLTDTFVEHRARPLRPLWELGDNSAAAEGGRVGG